MKKVGSLLKGSTIKPELTREEWAEIDRRVIDSRKAEAKRVFLKASETVPRAFINAKLEEVCEEARKWSEEPTVGLLIQGEVGRGKTYTACAILLDQVFRRTIRFTTFDSLLRECRATYDTEQTEEQVIGRLCSVGVLCIDDLGKEKATEWSLSVLFHIVNERHAELRPTIITTNCTGTELMKQLTVDGNQGTAKALLSRLKDYDRIVLRGEDRRGNVRRD